MPFTKLKKILCWTMVAACMIVIFLFSAQTATESAGTSNSVIKTFATILNPEFETLSSEEQNSIYNLYSHFIRKLAHFSIYALLGFFVALALLNYSLRLRQILFYSLTICTLYAVTDEVHQIFVPDRGPGILDVLVDAAGALFGSCIIICIYYIIKKIRKQNV